MVSRSLSNRMKAAAIAALMCLSVAGATVPLVYNAPMEVSAAVKIGETLEVGDKYRGTLKDIDGEDFTELIITVKAPYTGDFSFGLGVSTLDDPYWMEMDGTSGDWLDTSDEDVQATGTSVKVTANKETQIKLDVSKIGLKAGTFEFRNYYSADWSGGKEKMVAIELVSVDAVGSSSSSKDTTEKETTSKETTPSSSQGSVAKIGESLEVGDKYKGKLPDFKGDVKEVIITVEAPYTGDFSYGLGISTLDDPYWMEMDGTTGDWLDTKEDGAEATGTSVKVTANKETQIKLDASKIGVKPGASFEFRNYYSADWSGGKEKPVAIKLISVELTGSETADTTEAATTTAATTKATTAATTKATTEATTKATTEATTKATTEATTKATTTTQTTTTVTTETTQETTKAAETTTTKTETTTEETKPVKADSYGDVNGDGAVDILDVIAVNKHLLGVSKLTAQGVANADVNADGSVTSEDSLLILKCALEAIKQSDFPIKK